MPGAQIVSPVDARIEALMAAAPPEIPCYPVAPDDHEWAAASRYLDRLATRFDHVDDTGRLVFASGDERFFVDVDETLERAILEAKQIREESRSAPSASTATAVVIALSIPPDKPRRTPGNLFFST